MLAFMSELARRAGTMCVEESGRLVESEVERKNPRDLVTRVDRQVEELVRSAISSRFPGHGCLGEEFGGSQTASEHLWIIDPIDGTTSYVHGQPGYSVSLAYQYRNRTEAAVVYAPALGLLFAAERGAGSTLNGQKIEVSSRRRLLDCVLATGFACLRAGKADNNLPTFVRVMPHIRDIRRWGSAALDLAMVAAGRLDGFWERDLNIYDIAAGVLLVEEAGGTVSDFLGGSDYPQHGIVASNGHIAEALRLLLP